MKKNLLFFICILIHQLLQGQVGINTAEPNLNAALEVRGSSSHQVGGFMPPTVTQEQRDMIPVTADDDGLLLYVTVICGDRRLQMFSALSMSWEDIFSSEVPFKVWNFGNDAMTWPLSLGIGNVPVVVDNLGLVPIDDETNFGEVTNNSVTFSDGFTAVRRFRMNGPSYMGPFVPMPTRRYLYFGINGPARIKVWFRTNVNGGQRTFYVTDGVQVIGSETTNSGGNDDLAILEATYTGGPATLYLFNDLACNVYKVEVCGSLVYSP